MRSDQRQYLLEIIFVFVLLLGMTLLNECVNLLRSNGLQNSQEKTFWRLLCQVSVSMLGFQVFGASRVRDFHFWEAASYFRGTIAVLLWYAVLLWNVLADLEHSSFLIFFISCNCSSTSHCSHTYCISNINASSSDMTNLPTSAEKYGFISILNCWFKIWI